jgi:hypothetical protein
MGKNLICQGWGAAGQDGGGHLRPGGRGQDKQDRQAAPDQAEDHTQGQ